MKCGVSTPGGHLLLMLLLGVALAGPASGDPITIYFDGPVVDGEHKGVAMVPDGVSTLDIDVYSVVGSLGVVHQSGNDSIVEEPLAEVSSEWVVQNLYGDFPGSVYLLFSTAINREVTTSDGTFTTTYDTDFTDEPDATPNDHVGLVIDPDDGWIFVESELEVDDELTQVLYPGIRLDDFMSVGAQCGTDPATGQPVLLAAAQTCVAVRYFLEDASAGLFPDGADQVLGLPELRILMAVVPEPATGSLLALGLVALAAARRRQR